MIAVVTHLCWQVECTAQSGLSSLKQKLKPLVRVGCTSEACVLTHGPQPVAVHGWVNTSGVWLLARSAKCGCGVEGTQRFRRVQRINGDAGVGLALFRGFSHGSRLRDWVEIVAWVALAYDRN